MAVEKKFLAVPAQLLTVDGGKYGQIQVPDATLYKVKQCLMIASNTQTPLIVQINRINSDTEMEVGVPKKQISDRVDISAYLVADGARITADEQPRPSIGMDDVISAVYSEEPAVALRNILVDKLGKYYGDDNPLPVQLQTGAIEIGDVNAELEVQLSRQDGSPDSGDVHDSVRVGNQDGELSYTANDDESKLAADVNVLNKLIDAPQDDIEVVQYTADGDPEILEVREGGNLKRTLTLIYNADGDFQRVRRTKP